MTNYLKPGDTAVKLVAGVVTGGAAELQLRLDCGTLGGQPPLLPDSVRKVDPGLQSLLKHKMWLVTSLLIFPHTVFDY